MDNTRQHLDFLDFAKGIGIILVVMEHTICPVHEAISLFHIPLFFLLAGLTLRPYSDLGGFLIKKINRIFIPYIFFSVVSWFLAMAIDSDVGTINSPLWFLNSLFFAIVVCEVVLYSIPKYSLIVAFLFGLYGWFFLYSEHLMFPRHFNVIIRCSVFIFIGYYLKPYVIGIRCDRAKACFISFAIFVIWLLLTYVSIFKMGATGTFGLGSICEYNIIMFYATAIAGSLLVIYLSKVFVNLPLINWLGKNSLLIMCMHFPFLQYWNPFVSSLPFYTEGGMINKAMIALSSYVAAIAFSCLFIPLCKRFVPHLTGYKPCLAKNDM